VWALGAVAVLQQGSLRDRPLISHDQAADVVALFKLLANQTRLRLIHALDRAGELTVTELAEAVGASQQAVSNQLQRLVDRRILSARRDGKHVHYRIVDPCVTGLLTFGVCLNEQTQPTDQPTSP
jgi:ArsR family transcriptional regulator, lead/cadmium/zinc/bismuth-responsive transcriptional repressor